MAIATVYKGIRYRSQLEARWAAFMTAIGWEFQYEPFEGDGYIPDFIVYGGYPMFIEVKPAVTPSEYRAPAEKADRGLDSAVHDVLVVGSSWSLPGMASGGKPVAGWLGEKSWDGSVSRSWGWGEWITCANCGQNAVVHDHMSFAGRPCGCYDGDHYIRMPRSTTLREAWADACNDTQWRGRDA